MAADTYTVTRSTTIDAPPARVYEEIADFHNWTHWSPWEGLDPDLKRTYSGLRVGQGRRLRLDGQPQGRTGPDGDDGSDRDVDGAHRPGVPQAVQGLRAKYCSPLPRDAAGSRVTWVIEGQKTLMTKVTGGLQVDGQFDRA